MPNYLDYLSEDDMYALAGLGAPGAPYGTQYGGGPTNPGDVFGGAGGEITPPGAGGLTPTGVGGGGGGGALPSGFSSWAEYEQWRRDFAREHAGMTPEQYAGTTDISRLLDERQAGNIWAQQHGSPMSWGNRPGDNRVPLEIWKRISSARRSPDYGPRGPGGWAEAADLMGGGLLAMRGQKYHPDSATGVNDAKKKWLVALANAYMQGR